MTKLLLTIVDGEKNNAGPKAKEDIISILETEKIKSKKVTMNFRSAWQKIWYSYVYFPLFFAQNKNSIDTLYFQYPAYSYFMMNRIVSSFKKNIPSAKLFFIIHDIESLRLASDDDSQNKEFALLNQADGLVVHNQKMMDYLTNNGVSTRMIPLEIFDYLNPAQLNKSRQFKKSVCYAGNLKKSNFLNQLSFDQVMLDVYGSHPANNYNHGVQYKGIYSPEELPSHLSESFGLVWDGQSTSTCSGIFGNYLKYNDPHKVSLYLSSGIPVIIWKDAALAAFIEKNNLGFTIGDLSEIENKISNLSDEQYRQMLEHVFVEAEKLRKGHYIKTAVKKLL